MPLPGTPPETPLFSSPLLPSLRALLYLFYCKPLELQFPYSLKHIVSITPTAGYGSPHCSATTLRHAVLCLRVSFCEPSLPAPAL